jgi:hypothetical protein
MAFSNELLDQLLAECERSEDILGPQGLFAQLKKALAERALGAELGHHLTHEAEAPPRNEGLCGCRHDGPQLMRMSLGGSNQHSNQSRRVWVMGIMKRPRVHSVEHTAKTCCRHRNRPTRGKHFRGPCGNP